MKVNNILTDQKFCNCHTYKDIHVTILLQLRVIELAPLPGSSTHSSQGAVRIGMSAQRDQSEQFQFKGKDLDTPSIVPPLTGRE